MARAKADDDDVTEAHDQRMTVHIITVVPPHEPGPGDPHYDHYLQAITRLKRQRLWRCAINDDYCGGGIELHHTHVEAMSFRDVDLNKINEAFGLHLDDDGDFHDWIESPGNLEPLCVVHHRTHFGVHCLPHPLWEPLRYRKQSAKPSAEIESIEINGVEVDSTITTATKTVQKRTRAGVEQDRITDVTERTKVKDHGRTVDEVVEHKRTVAKRTVPRQRPKKGFLARLFDRA
jgi:hypothetical protein